MKRALAAALAALLVLSALGCSAGVPAITDNSETTRATAPESTAPAASVPDPTLPEGAVSELEGAQTAYMILGILEEETEHFGEDLCQVWHTGIWQEEDLVENGCGALAQRLHLEEDELREGLAHMIFAESEGDWAAITDEQWEQLRGQDEAFARAGNEDAMFDFCINVTWCAYLETGVIDMLEEGLGNAKDVIQMLQEHYPDSRFVEPLKEYYGVVHGYEQWCTEPVGSYNEAEKLLDDFRADCKKIHTELEFDLGE